MASIIEFWWLPVVSVLLVAVLIWVVKRKLSNNTDKREDDAFTTLGLLVAMAAAMFPSITGAAEPLLTTPRAVFLLIIIAITYISTSIVVRARKRRKSPNQAL